MLSIKWYEGLFVQPHQLQWEQQYHETLVELTNTLGQPYRYGVSKLELDQNELRGNAIAIRHLDAILPNGTIIAHSSTEVDSTPRLYAGDFFNDHPEAPYADLYCGIAARNQPLPEDTNAPEQQMCSIPRWRDTTHCIYDLHHDPESASPQVIQGTLLRLNVYIWLRFGALSTHPAPDLPPALTTLRLARLFRDTNTTSLSIVANYDNAPRLIVDSSVRQMMQLLLQHIKSTLRLLLQEQSSLNIANNVVRLISSSSHADQLRNCLSTLTATIAIGDAPPWVVYREMAKVITLLDILAMPQGDHSVELPAYDHNEGTSQIKSLINLALATLHQTASVAPMQQPLSQLHPHTPLEDDDRNRLHGPQ